IFRGVESPPPPWPPEPADWPRKSVMVTSVMVAPVGTALATSKLMRPRCAALPLLPPAKIPGPPPLLLFTLLPKMVASANEPIVTVSASTGDESATTSAATDVRLNNNFCMSPPSLDIKDVFMSAQIRMLEIQRRSYRQ